MNTSICMNTLMSTHTNMGTIMTMRMRMSTATATSTPIPRWS